MIEKLKTLAKDYLDRNKLENEYAQNDDRDFILDEDELCKICSNFAQSLIKEIEDTMLSQGYQKDAIHRILSTVTVRSSKESPVVVSNDEIELEEKYLYLKWGDLKGGDFNDSPEALEVYDKRKTCVTDEDYRKNAIEVIDLFNGKIFNWWTSTNLTKEEAKEYINTYKRDF